MRGSVRFTSGRRVLPVLAAAMVTTAMLAVPHAGAQNTAATLSSGRAVFGSPVVVDPVHTYGEPDIKIDDQGRTYDSGPWGTGTQRSIWNASTDGGQTFHTLHSPPMATTAQSDTQIPCPVPVIQCPGGGDTEISIDHTGKVYFSDLAALVNLKNATWDPNTDTMETGLFGTTDNGANGYDRQWFALWDPPAPLESSVRGTTGYTGPLPVNYLTYAEAALGCCEAAAYSTDGITYVGPTEEYSIANDGPLAIDQLTGTVFEAVTYDKGDDTDSLSHVAVAILTRDPANPDDPALVNSQIVPIADTPTGTNTRALFPVIAMDTARTLYVAWPTRNPSGTTSSEDPQSWQIFYSYARANSGWTKWSTPKQLSRPPANTNVMPWMTAGTGGRIAVVWYGTEDNTHDPSTEDAHQPWDVYMAMVSNASSTTPSIQQYRVTKHHIHYGTICLEGTGCIIVEGNRNNADFFYVTTDPRDGAPVITYNDTSNELTQENIGSPVEGTADHRGAPVVMSVRQIGGIGLFGTRINGTPATGKFLEDNALEDARFDPIYSQDNIPSLDLLGEGVPSRNGDTIDFRFHVNSLDDLQAAFTATGATAIDYVMRWTGAPVEDPETGTRNPIYYVAVEVTPDGSIDYFAGEAISVELCSVSGCFPHIIDYPRPPRGGTEVTGELEMGGPRIGHDHFLVHVPASVIGNPTTGSLLESFATFTFARNKSAAVPFTNPEGEGGIVPVMIDGVCCKDVKSP